MWVVTWTEADRGYHATFLHWRPALEYARMVARFRPRVVSAATFDRERTDG